MNPAFRALCYRKIFDSDIDLANEILPGFMARSINHGFQPERSDFNLQRVEGYFRTILVREATNILQARSAEMRAHISMTLEDGKENSFTALAAFKVNESNPLELEQLNYLADIQRYVLIDNQLS